MSADRDEIMRDLRERVARIAYLDPEAVQPDSRYVEDLHLESSGAVQLLVELEERYAVRIADDEARELLTLTETVALLERKLAAAG
jgi:acyl carrier protein